MEAEELETRLRSVKEKVVKTLEQGELDDNDYFQSVYKLLLEEEVVKGSYEGSTAAHLSTKIATTLIYKIPLKESRGLEKDYISLENRELSPETKEDLSKLSELEESTRTYLKKELEGKQIYENKFESIVKEYLVNHEHFKGMKSIERQRKMSIKISVKLGMELNIQKEPAKIGDYYVPTLNAILNKI